MKRWRIPFLLGVVLGGGRLLADPSPAYLVKDINVQPSSGFFVSDAPIRGMGGAVYFTGSTIETGNDLWRSDGTAAGTQRLKDVYGGVSQVFEMNGLLFYTAFEPLHGSELWKSDGTEAGTVMVKDIVPGPSGSGPTLLTNMNGTLYFSATGGLWKSDGSPEGTVLVRNVTPHGGFTNDLARFVVVNDTLFFEASDLELWKSDGTAAGTVRVKEIRPGSNPANVGQLTRVNDTLFLRAWDGTNGVELWKSDGTEAGTVMVKDIVPGSGGALPAELVEVNGALYFSANDGIHGIELWKSDGTPAGTVLVADIAAGADSSSPVGLTNVNGTLFFTDTATGKLWKSDGTAAGTVALSSSQLAPKRLTVLNGTLIFEGYDAANGAELWKSDGTAAGTTLLKDILPGSGSSNLKALSNVSGTLFFSATSGAGTQLWQSDGTGAGTVAVTSFAGTGSSSPEELTLFGDTLFLRASDGLMGWQLWKSDGTGAGTALVKEVVPPEAIDSSPTSLTPVNGTLFFTVSDGESVALWATDGSDAGTRFLKDGLSAQCCIVRHGNLTDLNGTLLFTAEDDTYGAELWRSDGTPAGTVLVKDIFPPITPLPPPFPPPPVASSDPQRLTVMNGSAFFPAWTSSFGMELWKSDGTEAGTVLVKDINPGFQEPVPPPPFPGTPYSSSPTDLTNLNGTLLFGAGVGIYGHKQLWRSDGTEAGTVMVKDIPFGAVSSSRPPMATVGNTMFFSLYTGTGVELWKTDGTSAGTVFVKGGFSGAFGVAVKNLTDLNGTLIFTANDGTHGVELWKSDGTTAGTAMVKDIWPGFLDGYDQLPGTSETTGPVAVGSVVVFTANDGVSGSELWLSDGTSEGTRRVADIAPGLGDSYPRSYAQFGERLYFSAMTNATSRELFAVPVAVLTDADLDGLLDADERALGTDLFVADSDGDGLSDGDEVHEHGTNPLVADTDGDGFDDGDEQLAGTDPLDPQSFPQTVPLGSVWGYAALAAWLLVAARSRIRITAHS